MTHYSSLITHYSSLITHHSSFTTHDSSLITHHYLKMKRPSKFAGPSLNSILLFLFETAERFCLVVIDVKDSQELCDHKQVLHLLSQVEQLQLAAAAIHGCVVRDQLADAARVDVL